MADSASQAACAANPPCLLGQRAAAPGKGAWQPSCPCSAEPCPAAGGPTVQGSGAAAVEHSTILLQLGTRYLHCLQVSYFSTSCFFRTSPPLFQEKVSAVNACTADCDMCCKANLDGPSMSSVPEIVREVVPLLFSLLSAVLLSYRRCQDVCMLHGQDLSLNGAVVDSRHLGGKVCTNSRVLNIASMGSQQTCKSRNFHQLCSHGCLLSLTTQLTQSHRKSPADMPMTINKHMIKLQPITRKCMRTYMSYLYRGTTQLSSCTYNPVLRPTNPLLYAAHTLSAPSSLRGTLLDSYSCSGPDRTHQSRCSKSSVTY